MNTKQILGAALLALAGVAAQATVTTSVVGQTTTYTENFTGGSSFSGGYYDTLVGTDDYMWLTSPFGTSSSSYSFSSAVGIASMTISLWYSAFAESADGVLSGGLFSNSGDLTNTGSFSLVTFNNPGADSNLFASTRADRSVSVTWNNLAAGTYTLGFGVKNGQLKIDDVNIAVTAVPEPETYAMMLAGLGLMGTIARRRKAKQA